MVNYESDIARVSGQVGSVQQVAGSTHSTDYKLHATNLEVVLTRGQITVGEDPEKVEKVARKKLLVNGIAKRLIDFAGNLRVVLFAPHDLLLVTESPSVRRRFLDVVLSQVNREYRRSVLSFEKGLRQRNKLLWQIRENRITGSARSMLLFWNKLLIKNGDYIGRERNKFIEFVNAGNFHFSSPNFHLEYDKSAISEGRLAQYAQEEVAAATTLVGPHRDDFVFKIGKNSKVRSLDSFGSRGEQRMGVLWLKMAELGFVKEITKEDPILLLDDIFSELDHEHRGIVMDAITGQQTIITAADPHFVVEFKGVNTIKL
jgi:DNA replication and repair protein RecF